jgi:hypothetical protein
VLCENSAPRTSTTPINIQNIVQHHLKNFVLHAQQTIKLFAIFNIVFNTKLPIRESRNAYFPETLGINHFLIWGGGLCCEKLSLIFATKKQKKNKKNKQELSLKKDARRSTYIIFFYEQYFTEIT